MYAILLMLCCISERSWVEASYMFHHNTHIDAASAHVRSTRKVLCWVNFSLIRDENTMFVLTNNL